MPEINYIKHLNGVFIQFTKDSRLNPTHISLYIALFQLWNYNRFPDEFYIHRDEVMAYSKIGSKSTYHKSIKELSHWKYIVYYPSHNPFKGSKVRLFDFGTSSGQALDYYRTKIETSTGQALVPLYKHIQTIENNNKPKNKKEVFDFFEKMDWPISKAKQFFSHYESVGWRKGNVTIENWQAAAESWILKSEALKIQQTSKVVDQNSVLSLSKGQDNLKTSTNKDYNEPL
ncbi:hypothetical protein [Aquimarina sp. RZ0]|uniref:hypothetical protein n=1 Tax=Aquimarina sp. RZ0 TaxID=2607730 RepID=UPI0011F1C86A|nr:hypothetical protein [Aquimarina sp. RZ0]KAA1245788.1 hypothetical protein F0000_10320 [Aquimarina sp. RZ0]